MILCGGKVIQATQKTNRQNAQTVSSSFNEQKHLSGYQQSQIKIFIHEWNVASINNMLLFLTTTALSRAEGFWDQVILEAIEIHNEPHTVNRNVGLTLNSSWVRALQLTAPPLGVS